MDLCAINRTTNKMEFLAPLPLEFVDWMSICIAGPFIAHMAKVDPYKDVLIPDSQLETACEELRAVRSAMMDDLVDDYPATVEQHGSWSRKGSLNAIDESVRLLRLAIEKNYKVIRIGD